MLPCELVGLTGTGESNGCKNDLETSCLKWEVEFSNMPKPSPKTQELWKEFKIWLKEENIVATYDFGRFCSSECYVSNDRKCAK